MAHIVKQMNSCLHSYMLIPSTAIPVKVSKVFSTLEVQNVKLAYATATLVSCSLPSTAMK